MGTAILLQEIVVRDAAIIGKFAMSPPITRLMHRPLPTLLFAGGTFVANIDVTQDIW
jgi:hypothetical protein